MGEVSAMSGKGQGNRQGRLAGKRCFATGAEFLIVSGSTT